MTTALELEPGAPLLPLAARVRRGLCRGGFDVALGNPPWERQSSSKRRSSSPAVTSRSQRTQQGRAGAADQGAGNSKPCALRPNWRRRNTLPRRRACSACSRALSTHRGRRSQHLRYIRRDIPRADLRARTLWLHCADRDRDRRQHQSVLRLLTSERRLVSLLRFREPRARISWDHSRMQFCLLTLAAAVTATTFTFFATRYRTLRR